VRTAAGSICGTTDTTVVRDQPVAVPVYRGIPYAVAPIPANNLRWRPTQPLAAPDTVIRATAFGPACAQSIGADTTSRAPRLVVADTLGGRQSEDCLFLNVWTPPDATAASSLPVMVFIHGGAFITGAGSLPTYNGAYLAAADTVVVVTLNYRLGAPGFLYSTAHRNQVPGNLGLLDQRTAMEWVRRNIGAFGGDSSRVTVFGESAGAMSVGFHLFSMPGSDSLFRAAIMESNPMGAVYRGRKQAQRDGNAYIRALCDVMGGGLACLLPFTRGAWFNAHAQRATTLQVMEAQRRFEGPLGEGLRVFLGGLPQVLPWTPTVDGALVVGQPLEGYAPGMRPKPYVFGFNRDEGVLFAAFADTLLTGLEYNLLLDRVFLLQAGQVRDFSSGGVHPYDAGRDTSVAGMEPAASALSNLITDMVFKCANLASADSAYHEHQHPVAPDTARPPIFGYLFQRSPVPFNPFPKFPECSAARGTVCHGDELPYVFNTLAAIDSTHAGAPVQPDDRSLARQMAAAWGNFAKRPMDPVHPQRRPLLLVRQPERAHDPGRGDHRELYRALVPPATAEVNGGEDEQRPPQGRGGLFVRRYEGTKVRKVRRYEGTKVRKWARPVPSYPVPSYL
jgi:para-nitrobenzyl esterase